MVQHKRWRISDLLSNHLRSMRDFRHFLDVPPPLTIPFWLIKSETKAHKTVVYLVSSGFIILSCARVGFSSPPSLSRFIACHCRSTDFKANKTFKKAKLMKV